MATFNIATFNCAGMADATRRTALLNLFRKLPVQIICVQETHSRPENEVQWAREWAPDVVILNKYGKRTKWRHNLHQRLQPTGFCRQTRFKWPSHIYGRLDPSLHHSPNKHLCPSQYNRQQKQLL